MKLSTTFLRSLYLLMLLSFPSIAAIFNNSSSKFIIFKPFSKFTFSC
ncbi:hypothetical protein BBU94A_I08 (plasmid) [Borreliella burgdorferi 94a]|nr:hypothetical protein BBU72A_I0011 [Borreliella burgdorferi 72a]ACN92086.1 hypothetical protein BBU94A_I08 [Borreliella burgdorferi 94a]